jgi:LysM repeat protein
VDSEPCLRFEDEAVSFVLGDLDGAVRARMVSHLDSCSPCRREVAALNTAVDVISASTTPVEPSPGFVGRVLASAEEHYLTPPLAAPSRPVPVVVRRRRTLLSLSAVTAALAVAGVEAHSLTLSVLAAFAAALALAYLGLIVAVTRTKARSELATAWPADDVWWRGLEPIESTAAAPAAERSAAPTVALDNAVLARFVVSYFTGWLLTPVVAAIGLVRGDLSDVEQSPVLGRVVALQRQGRAQSLRLLAAGVTTVVVAGGGTATATILLTPQAASAAPAPQSYVVRAGDTLSAIAQRYGVSVTYLARLNGISDPNVIVAGEVIHLGATSPAASAASPASAGSGSTYTVQDGDTLDSIAARLGTTAAALAAANHLTDPNLIFAGQVLAIPHGSIGAGTEAPATTEAPAPTEASATAEATTPTTTTPPPTTPAPSTTPAPPAPVTSGYVNPFTQGSWSPARIDQGVDWIPNAPSPVVAIGDGVITYSSTGSGWPGGGFISYRLTSGSHAGLYIYVAEHLTNLLPTGTVVHAGEQIATALPGDPWTEWGWASANGPAPAPGSQYNGAPDGTATAGGKAFARFLISIGVTGVQDPGPGPTTP